MVGNDHGDNGDGGGGVYGGYDGRRVECRAHSIVTGGVQGAQHSDGGGSRLAVQWWWRRVRGTQRDVHIAQPCTKSTGLSTLPWLVFVRTAKRVMIAEQPTSIAWEGHHRHHLYIGACALSCCHPHNFEGRSPRNQSFFFPVGLQENSVLKYFTKYPTWRAAALPHDT